MKTTTLSVSQLTKKIKIQLEEGIGSVIVEGEISNFKQHSSGHRYFSLKDDNAQIACTMWRSRPLNFQASDGMKVIARGKLSVYPPRGNYQIDVSSLSPLGTGDLFMAFEALKNKLNELGYFDEEIKKPLPEFIGKIGLATSETGAAVRDILSTLKRRFPVAEVLFRSCAVQGSEAAQDIVDSIQELEKENPDVIIIGRGGGSMEDLWPFNEEIVANAIYNCKTPIISAVGHETDFTISDFVADLRAATPTAAAELATPILIDNLKDYLDDVVRNLETLSSDKINELNDHVDNMISDYLINRIQDKLHFNQQRVDEMLFHIDSSMSLKLKDIKSQIDLLSTKTESLDPDKALKKGYAILRSDDKIINVNDDISENSNIQIERIFDISNAKIEKVNKK